MRKLIVFNLIIILFLTACVAAGAPLRILRQQLASPTPGSPPAPAAPTATLAPLPTATEILSVPTVIALPSAAATVSSVPTLPASAFTVRYHPDGRLYAGDLISFEVLAHPTANLSNKRLRVRLAGALEPIGEGEFGYFDRVARSKASLVWAWDTGGLPPGDYDLEFAVLPDGPTWREVVNLLPADDLPAWVRQASWQMLESECCQIHFVSGTASARDLEDLAERIDAQARQAQARLPGGFDEPIVITLLPRVLGHGGFAGGEISVSYLDRNYASGNPDAVLLHEMIHILDRQLGGELRPDILVEGLAVYLTGGHFKEEPIAHRAAALLARCGQPARACLNGYIALNDLSDDFYQSQHEIGYLQGAALIQYMVETWGWERFQTFYRDIQPALNGDQSDALDTALREHFQLNLLQVEDGFVNWLAGQSVRPDEMEDLRLTVAFYDTVRRYQLALDPSAYFLSAWLVDNAAARQRGIFTDYQRVPAQPANLALEALLVQAGADLQAGRYAQANELIETANQILAAWEAGAAEPFAASPLALDYWQINAALARHPSGQPARIAIQGDQATAWLSQGDQPLKEVRLERRSSGWSP